MSLVSSRRSVLVEAVYVARTNALLVGVTALLLLVLLTVGVVKGTGDTATGISAIYAVPSAMFALLIFKSARPLRISAALAGAAFATLFAGFASFDGVSSMVDGLSDGTPFPPVLWLKPAGLAVAEAALVILGVSFVKALVLTGAFSAIRSHFSLPVRQGDAGEDVFLLRAFLLIAVPQLFIGVGYWLTPSANTLLMENYVSSVAHTLEIILLAALVRHTLGVGEPIEDPDRIVK